MDYLIGALNEGSASLSDQDMERLADAYLNVNPQASLTEQYIDYMSSMLRGDFGTSVWYNDPVSDILGQALPWTVFLFGTATLVMYGVGIFLGAMMAYKEGTRFDSAWSVTSIFVNSVPYYVVAILFVFVLGYQMELFPINGRFDQSTTPGLNLQFILGVYYHATLPALSIILTGFGGLALLMRGNSIQVLGSDYNRVARLRGLSTRRIATRYVARNAILPIYTNFMISIGTVLGGSVILEMIFVYRGIGYYLFKAIEVRDFPLMMGAFLLLTFAVILAIFVMEITYAWIDPRATEGGGAST